MNLLVVIPFHNGDAALTKQLLEWMRDMGAVLPDNILLAADSQVPLATCKEIADIARNLEPDYARHVHTASFRVEAKDWRAPNLMFHHVATHIKDTFRDPFFWMEPDCVPLHREWVLKLNEEQIRCAKRYMGRFVTSTEDGLPPLHMTGCGIYPNDAIDLMRPFCDQNATSAWDMGSAQELCVNKKADNTHLIQLFWGKKDLPPTFVEKKVQGIDYPLNCLDLSFLEPGAVIFHRCKDGSLIQALRERNKRIGLIEDPEPKLPALAQIIREDEASEKRSMVTKTVAVKDWGNAKKKSSRARHTPASPPVPEASLSTPEPALTK